MFGAGSHFPGLGDEYTPEFTTASERSSIVKEKLANLEKVRSEYRAGEMNARLKLAAKNRIPSCQFSNYNVDDRCSFYNAKDRTWDTGRIVALDKHSAVVQDDKNSQHKVVKANLRPVASSEWDVRDLHQEAGNPGKLVGHTTMDEPVRVETTDNSTEEYVSCPEAQSAEPSTEECVVQNSESSAYTPKGEKQKKKETEQRARKKERRSNRVEEREQRITRTRMNTEDEVVEMFKGTSKEPEVRRQRKKKVRIVEGNKKYNTRLSSTDQEVDSVFEDDEDMSDIERKLVRLRKERNCTVEVPIQDPEISTWMHSSAGFPRKGEVVQVREDDGRLRIGVVHRLPRPGSTSRTMLLVEDGEGEPVRIDMSGTSYRKIDRNLKPYLPFFKCFKVKQ